MQRLGWIIVFAVLAFGVWTLTQSEDTTTPTAPRTPNPDDAVLIDGTDPRPPPLLEGNEKPPKEADPVEPNPVKTAQGNALTYTGIVVGMDHKPVASASVVAHAMGGVVGEAQTDDDGGFRLTMAPLDPGHQVFATLIAHADTRVGHRTLSLFQRHVRGDAARDPERNAGRIMIRPGDSLRVQVETTCASTAPATVWLVPTQFGPGDPVGRRRVDAEGKAHFEGLVGGRWRVIAAAPGCGRVGAMVQLPRADDTPLQLVIPEERVLTVHVREADTKQPIPHARVIVREQLLWPDGVTFGSLVSVPARHATDARGQLQIKGLGDGETIQVFAAADGFPMSSQLRIGAAYAEAKPNATEVMLELTRAITVRWAIEDKGRGIPPDGTQVRILGQDQAGRSAGPTIGTMQDGELVVPGWGPDGAFGFAEVEGFGKARLQAASAQTIGHPTAFYRMPQIEVFAKHADGTPATDFFLDVRDGGNHPVGPRVPLNETGYAVMTGLPGDPGPPVDVALTDSETGWGKRFLLGSVNLAQQDGRFTFTIPPARKIRMSLTIKGHPAPPDFVARPTVSRQLVAFERANDGSLHVSYIPHPAEKELTLGAQAYGHRAKPVPIALTQSDPIAVVIDLVPLGSVRVRVTLPEDKRHRVGLQRWDPARDDWGRPSQGRRADTSGVVLLAQRAPGRARAVDTHSGIASAPFDIVAGQTADVSLDLSKAGWVQGRVQPPEGASFEGFAVQIEPQATLVTGRGARVDSNDGTFRIRVPGDRPVTLRVTHLTFRPHPAQGEVTLTAPRTNVVLQAVHGARATLVLSKAVPVLENPGRPRPVPVRLYTNNIKGAGDVRTGIFDPSKRKVVFGGYAPGNYTLWIDVPSVAPLVIRNAQLGDGETDLGTVTPADGSTLRIRLRTPEGESAPRVTAWVKKRNAPIYQRRADSISDAVLVRGLGPGRFQVTARADGTHAPFTIEIDVDGSADVERVWDLR